MDIEISQLPCGLRVVTDTIKTVETVSLGIWVGAGSRNESEANNGVAHFLEHMAFKGTQTRTALQIAEEIESVGGYLNAYTSREVTAYYARVLKQDTKLALNILTDILQNSIFDPAEMEREREVILQEIGQSYDTPDDIIFDYFQETAYPNQSLGRPILGPASLVKSMSRETLIDFMKKHYNPEQMVLVASGNIDHKSLLSWAEDMLDLPKAAPVEDYAPAQFVGGDFRQARELEQLHFLLGMKGPGAQDPDYYDGTIFSTILGGGMSSRLFQEVREKRGLVYSIYSFLTAQSDVGTFGIYAGTGGKEIGTLVDVVSEELHKMTQEVSEQELLRAKSQMKAGLLMGLENSSGRARRIAHTLLTYGKYISIDEVIQKIDRVTVEGLRNFGVGLLSQSLCVSAIGPLDNLPEFDHIQQRFVAKKVA